MKSPRTSLVELLQPVAEGMERVREILGRELAEESGAVSDMTMETLLSASMSMV